MRTTLSGISKPLLLLILSALIVRILVLLWSVPLNINGDQTRYEDWAQVTHVYGMGDSYTSKHVKTLANNMPPGSLYFISAAYELYILTGKIIAKITQTAPGSIHFVNTFLIHVMMRIPSILTDIGMGILAYVLVRREMKEKRALLAASLIFFTPVIFYNSSIWGQMDSLNNFLFLASLLLAFQKKYVLSIILYGLSLYTKVSLLPLLPFYFLFLFFHSQKKWKQLLLGILLSLLLIFLLTYPISTRPFEWLITNIPVMAGGELQNITVAAFNFWWMITCGPITCPDSLPFISDKFLGVSLQSWGYLLFALFSLPILMLQIKKPDQFIQKKTIFLAFSLVALLVFLFLPKMHDRYLYPFFPLFALGIVFLPKIKKFLLLYIVLALVHMGNIIYSYFPAFIHPLFTMKFYTVISIDGQ